MKQAQFTLNNKELLLVELPDIEDCDPVLVNESELFINGVYHALPFRVKLIGKLPEVTEEEYNSIVPEFLMGYEDYGSDSFNGDAIDFFQTAKESFFSKLEAEGIVFGTNYDPASVKLPEYRSDWTFNHYEHQVRQAYEIAYKEWQSAQEKVFNIENTYLFEKV